MLSLPLLPSLAMDMVMDTDMATVLTGTDTPAMARGLLMLSPDTVTTAVDTDTDTATDTATAMDMATDMATAMARGPLMPSPDMATTAVGTEDTVVDTTDTAMVTVMATTDEVAASRSSC